METRLIGKIVSRRFRIEEVIGRGGMSLVYRAFDLKSHQTVAVKVLREEYENDAEYRERFEREADVCRRLNHPNIVNLISSGTAGGISYITMEYVDGQTLKEIIQERGKLPQEEAVHYALQMLAALGQAHSRGVIHRDVKPQNMMVTRTGQLKVTDFGIAGIAETETLTNDGTVIGSVHYFSPEQAKGQRATAASDLYSVGVILYEMLCGKVPFEGESAMAVAMKHLMQEPEPIESKASVSPAIAAILAHALKKNIHERYQNADDMTRDLRRALRHPDGHFLLNQRSSESQQAGSEKNNNSKSKVTMPLLVGIIVALCAAIGITGFHLYRSMFVMVSVPSLVGLDAGSAKSMIEENGLLADVVYAYDELSEGTVISQSPDIGVLERGSTMTLTVSLGSGIVNIPRFTGYTLNEALDIAVAQGFIVRDTQVVPSDKMKGSVIEQQPEAGSSGIVGSDIYLVVSGGRVIVPELTGIREEDALQRIEEVGLLLDEEIQEDVDSPRMDGIVLSQSLDTFTEVLPDTSVDLVVGYYEKRRYTSMVWIDLLGIPDDTIVRVTLVDDDGEEYDMYQKEKQAGEDEIEVLLRSETSGMKTWRLYLDGNFKNEASSVLR